MITGEIVRLAGEPTLNYLLGIEEGRLDYICRIPREAQIRIILNLDLEDIQRLGRTCKMFREVVFQYFYIHRAWTLINSDLMKVGYTHCYNCPAIVL